MHVYLDTRDLIDLVERRSAKDTDRFEERLRKSPSQLIFSMHNIMECCGPLVHAAETFNVMTTLNRLEQMPHLYLAEARIEDLELREATSAFLEKREYQTISVPIVPRFDYVVSPFEQPATKDYIGYSLAQVIFELWRVDENLFAGYPSHAKRLRVLLDSDRKRTDYKRHDLNFPNTVVRDLRLYGIRFPHESTDALSKWIFENPSRCPALRLGYEVFHKLVRNLTDSGENSDIPDFAHISCLPYVDAITLDNRMRGYVAQVDKSIGTNYSKNIYRNLDEIEALF